MKRTALWLVIAVATVCPLQSQVTEKGQAGDFPAAGQTANHAALSARDSKTSADKLLQSAVEMIEKKDYSTALTLLHNAATLAPEDANVHHYLGYALLHTEQVIAAKKEFETAFRLNPGNYYTEYFLGFIAFSQGDFNQAARHFEMLISTNHAVYDTYQRLSQSYMRLGNLSKAMTMTQKALQETPWDGSLHFQLGRIYQKMGRGTEAQGELETAERLNRADRESIRELRELSEAIDAGQRDHSVELCNNMLDQFAGKPELLRSLGILLGDKGQYPEALQPLRLAAELEPNSYEDQFNLGFDLLKLGQYTEAEPTLRKALELRSDSFQANSTLAILFINQDRPQEAIERLQAAHSISPEDANILVLLGQEFLKIDKPQEAIQALGKAIKLMPGKPEIRYLLIEAYDQESDYRNALASAQEAKRSFPSDARSCFEVGFQLANMGRNQEARPYAEKAIQIDPSFVPAYNLLGDVESRNGDYESALKTFQKASNLAPQNVDASVGIAKSLVQLNRSEDALTGLQEAIKIHPESADLYFVLTQVYVRLGDKKEAAQANAIFQRLHAESSLKR